MTDAGQIDRRVVLGALIPLLGVAVLCGDAVAQRRSTTQESAAAAAPDQANYRERYGVLSDRNIFLKERGRRERGDNSRTRPSGPTIPEQSFVLTGIVFEGGEYYAFVEDVARGSVKKVTVGEPVARGHVASIEIDAIVYEGNGAQQWVDIGCNLTGAPVGSVSAARVNAALLSTPSAGAAPGAAPIDPNSSSLSIEERLRLRRLQESQPGLLVAPTTEPSAEGAEPQAPQNDEAPQPAEAEGVQTSPAASEDPAANLSVEERLRLRRAQETNR